MADLSDLKLACKVLACGMTLPGFLAIAAFVMAIAPDDGRTGAFVASDGAAARLHPPGFNPTIAGEPQ